MQKVSKLEQHYFQQNINQSDEIFNQQLQRQKQNEAAQFGRIKLRDMFPVNFISEKQKFFKLNGQYSPHFLYKTVVYPEPIILHTDYEELAMKIIKNSPPLPTNIHYLNQKQVIEQIETYLEALGLKQYVQIRMQFECLSRTSVAFYKNKAVLKVRTPLSYTTVSLQGVLNHEVATHILRTLNHKQNCIRKPSERGKIIQQGLAAINQLLPEQKPFLFKPAVRYLTAIYSSKVGFEELYKKINKFIYDKDQCWRQCVRVKRGLGNTEQKGGFYKDQNYLIGAIEVLKKRDMINFQKIYYGKFAPEQINIMSQGVLPPFLGTPEKLKWYKKKLQKIALCNFIGKDENFCQ